MSEVPRHLYGHLIDLEKNVPSEEKLKRQVDVVKGQISEANSALERARTAILGFPHRKKWVTALAMHEALVSSAQEQLNSAVSSHAQFSKPIAAHLALLKPLCEEHIAGLARKEQKKWDGVRRDVTKSEIRAHMLALNRMVALYRASSSDRLYCLSNDKREDHFLHSVKAFAKKVEKARIEGNGAIRKIRARPRRLRC